MYCVREISICKVTKLAADCKKSLLYEHSANFANYKQLKRYNV